MRCVSLSMLSILYDLCRDFDVPWALDCLSIPIGDLALDDEGTSSNLAGGSLNVPPGLSLNTSAFIFTLPAGPMGACAFCLSSLGFLNVGVESISILSLFLVSIEGFGVGFWFFSFFFDLEVDLCLLFVACISFLGGRICCFIFCWVAFDIFFLWSLFWRFMLSVLMWVVASSESSVIVSRDLCPLGWICWIMGWVHLLGFFV